MASLAASSVFPAAGPVPAPACSVEDVQALLELRSNDLLDHAHGVHRANFPPHTVQLAPTDSIFCFEQLPTTANPRAAAGRALMARLGIAPLA